MGLEVKELTYERTIAASVTKLVIFYDIAVSMFIFITFLKSEMPLTMFELQDPTPVTRISHV